MGMRQALSQIGKDRGVFRGKGGLAKVIQCPLCNKDLTTTHMGVQAHLRKHVNSKELDAAGARTLARKLLPGLDAILRDRCGGEND